MTITGNFLGALFAYVALGSSTSERLLKHHTQYDPQSVAWSLEPGSSTLEGTASWSESGTVNGCSGQEVALIPQSTYSDEEMQAVFGSLTEGKLSQKKMVGYQDTDGRHLSAVRKTKCDTSGRFHFTNIPAGKYYVLTNLQFKTGAIIVSGLPYGRRAYGGLIMRRIELSEGQKLQIILN